MNRLARVSLILLATLVALTIGGVAYAEPPTERPGIEGVTLTVGGVERPVRLGQVVDTPSAPPGGPSDAPLVCNTPPMTISIEGSSGVRGVTVSTDEDCVVSVTEIKRRESGGAEAASGPNEIHYHGWAQSARDWIKGRGSFGHHLLPIFDHVQRARYTGKSGDYKVECFRPSTSPPGTH